MTVPKTIKLPDDASSGPIKKPDETIILNPIFEKKYLTIQEVLSCINHFSAVLLADGCYTGEEEHKRYLQQTPGNGVRTFP
ncbi:hypothetical protein LCGC14_0502890 [marine sediment metagenome]|uniref:Uncharacterized protein n=1 Tax=marine sediment metagenome TaxID=412755 RepID=A0A0F9UQA8_9ZZZZ